MGHAAAIAKHWRDFRCIAGCPGKHSIFDVIYTCPICGSLLEVHHEREPLKKRSASEWKQLFASRASTTTWPYGSGVWGLREWVIPSLADENVVSMFEGNTNLFWAERLGSSWASPICGSNSAATATPVALKTWA
jgi:threonine synthase